MKFTKENVVKVVDDYFCQADFESCTDLIAEIHNLSDTTEKVVVPKVVAEWIEGNKEMEVSLQTLLKCYANFYRGELDIFSSEWLKALQWYVENPYKFIRAYEEGYIVEPEQLYYIPLPDLETSDGKQQVLCKRKNSNRYFASRPEKT